MTDFNWTTDLVAEMLNRNGINPEIIDSFVNQKTLLPLNVKIKWFELNGEQYSMRGYEPSILLTEGIKILSCIFNDTDFRIGDLVYNSIQYKKYKGKWSNYSEIIRSLDLKVDRKDGIIVSSKLLINNFYDISNFIKR
jgi:hypothetical protein